MGALGLFAVGLRLLTEMLWAGMPVALTWAGATCRHPHKHLPTAHLSNHHQGTLKKQGLLQALKYTVCCVRRSVVSDFLQPRGLRPASLRCPWDSLGTNAGVGCHSAWGHTKRPQGERKSAGLGCALVGVKCGVPRVLQFYSSLVN